MTMHKITNVSTGKNITSNNMVAIYATTANGQVFCFDDLCPIAKAPAFVEKVSGYGVINTSCWTKVRNANGTRPKALGSRPAKAVRAPQPQVAKPTITPQEEIAKLKKQVTAITIRARKAEAQLYAIKNRAVA